jgi:hypothetical protein
VGRIKAALTASLIFFLTACSYRTVECPGAIPGGYYNGYFNKNAMILYKRPSNKFGCWRTFGGWDCIRR